MPKYKDYVLKMLIDNEELFRRFKILHDKYELDGNKYQDEYNEFGERVLEIVRDYENRLCRDTERGKYNKFSANLAEKFQDEVRNRFPLIDNVGVKVDKFVLKKIKLR